MSLKSLSKLNKMLETLTDKEIGENKPGLKTGAISSLDRSHEFSLASTCK